MLNRERAGSSYRVADPAELETLESAELSGLPWGSFNMRHVVAKGHERASRHGSRKESDNTNTTANISSYLYDDMYLVTYEAGAGTYPQPLGGFDAPDSSNGEEVLCEEPSPYCFEYEPINPGGGAAAPGGMTGGNSGVL